MFIKIAVLHCTTCDTKLQKKSYRNEEYGMDNMKKARRVKLWVFGREEACKLGNFVQFVRDLFVLNVVLYGYERTPSLLRTNFNGCYGFPYAVAYHLQALSLAVLVGSGQRRIFLCSLTLAVLIARFLEGVGKWSSALAVPFFHYHTLHNFEWT